MQWYFRGGRPKKLPSKATAQQLYQSLTVLHQCRHLKVYLNLTADFLDTTLLSQICLILLFFHGVTQTEVHQRR